jgi:phage protein D
VYSLRKAFNGSSDALNAATAKLADYQRGTATLSVTAPGDARVLAETKLTLSGFRDGYAGPWIVKDATHTVSGAGYTMNINAEIKKGA